MAPYRAPSPFQTTATPGDAFSVESSIVLEASGIHELAVSSATSGPSTTTPKVQKTEYILLSSNDLYPSAVNGVDVTAVPLKTFRVCGKIMAGWCKKLKATGRGVSAVVIPSRAATPIPASAVNASSADAAAVPQDDDASSIGPWNGAGGTSLDSVPVIQSKEVQVRFSQALWGHGSMSKSICVEAYINGPAEDAPEEVIARIESLFKDLGGDGGVESAEVDGEGTGGHDYAGAKADVLTSSFILINLRNDLDGDGHGYLQIQTLDDGHCGDNEVAHCGTAFEST